MKHNGFFLTLEGGEGVGKTTFSEFLYHELKSLYPSKPILVTREPGGTFFSEKIRELFRQHDHKEKEFWLPVSELCLVSAARAQHVTFQIKPYLDQGGIVICDRFVHSTYVYQGVFGHILQEDIDELVRMSTFGIKPDQTCFFFCDFDTAKERKKERGQMQDRFDQKDRDFHEKIEAGFRHLAQAHPNESLVIDSTESMADNLKKTLEYLKPFMNKKLTVL